MLVSCTAQNEWGGGAAQCTIDEINKPQCCGRLARVATSLSPISRRPVCTPPPPPHTHSLGRPAGRAGTPGTGSAACAAQLCESRAFGLASVARSRARVKERKARFCCGMFRRTDAHSAADECAQLNRNCCATTICTVIYIGWACAPDRGTGASVVHCTRIP